ncbi:hypothetical protein TSAR_013658 [Trichomalopsis sarcophagae]|uniref:Uncharacterized protein n=1 Tax=Trichomalopsis sarcophagae TaxID=543379 RepID=A0A232EV14_9HYME|nr:hypothetical protein TSAR_013658 [Trichomalopsis sarcophagae]
MATFHILEYQKRNSMEWIYMADSSRIFKVGSLHLNNLQSSLRLKAESHDAKYICTLLKIRTLFEHKSVKNYSPYMQLSTIKQHLHLKKIAWYPMNHPGSPPKFDKK